MKSAQIPSLILAVYYGDDNVDDCDDYNGHLQKNLPQIRPKGVPLWEDDGRCDPLESPDWVRPARQVLIYLLQYVWCIWLMMMMMIVMMMMVNFERICQKTSERSLSLGGCPSVVTLWRG